MLNQINFPSSLQIDDYLNHLNQIIFKQDGHFIYATTCDKADINIFDQLYLKVDHPDGMKYRDQIYLAGCAYYFYQQNLLNEKLSLTDDVTDLGNQRKLVKDLKKLLDHIKKDESFKFNILFIDVDKFKQVNDEFGHLVGSFLLVEISKIVMKHFKSDYLYRYGGDEFVVILPHIDEEQATKMAQEFSWLIKEKKFLLPNNQTHRLSVSIGISQSPDNAQTFEEIINLADQMMYNSKKSGLGQVVHVNQMIRKG
jgi:diguanylate cyclase (GGDEF)-like protein